MYIDRIINTTEIYFGVRFTLPSNLVRYVEFENVLAILLDNHGQKNKVIGVKFSQANKINHGYIAWEYQIFDNQNKARSIDYFVAGEYNGQKVICCHAGGDTLFYIDPDTGSEIGKEQFKPAGNKMYIEVKDINTINIIGSGTFTLPSNLVRYIEFENVVAILLDEGGKQNRLIGVKSSKEKGPYIAWEFQVVDGMGKVYQIASFFTEEVNDNRIIVCYGFGFDIIWYINPDDGSLIKRVPTKW
jgi:hypothetical protein